MTLDPTKLTKFCIENYFDSGKSATITPLDAKLYLNAIDIKSIISICNQADVYDTLFRTRLQNKAYLPKDAEGFISWANEGWKTGKYFVFIIRDQSNEIIGAIDIKSNDPDFGEIGYWVDENSPGYMTNAVIGLIEIAKSAGYKKLGAHVLLDNTASRRVLERANFKQTGKESPFDEKHPRYKYKINL